MARVSKVEAYEAVLRELDDEADAAAEAILDDIWFTMALDEYPPGVDFYLLRTAVMVGWQTTERWLGLVLGLEEDPDKFWKEANMRLRRLSDLEPLICGIELFHRRRMRAEPAWPDYRSQWVNGLIRAKSRAIKMLGANAAEVAA